jgi:polar amino acid transport system substrate-binding protein
MNVTSEMGSRQKGAVMRPMGSPKSVLAVNHGRFMVLAAVMTAWALLFGSMQEACGQSGPEVRPVGTKLMVGTKEAPPFSMKDIDGRWTGISIDLWRQIAAELNLTYEFQELDQHNLLAGLTNRSLDVVVAVLTITPERLDKFDFTYPFYTTGLGLAVPLKKKGILISIIEQLISNTVLGILIIICLVLLIVGIFVWLFERKINSEQFGGNAIQGIGSGFWFAAVTMTAVGYGDKHPKTIGGRITSLILMFSGVILVSLFTATITSILTVKQLESSVHGLEDLKKALVGTMPDTTSESFLKNSLISFKTYNSVEEGLEALLQGEIKAFVYDAPELRYRIKQRFQGKLDVLPHTYSQESYGIALVENSPLRKSINQVLLQKIRDQEWQGTLYHYLGR